MAKADTIVGQVRAFGFAGLLGIAVFTASLIVLHLTRTDIDWATRYVSDFANGRLGWVLVFGTLVHGVGNLALTLGLRWSLDPGPLRAWAVFFFGLAAAGTWSRAFPSTRRTGSSTVGFVAHPAIALLGACRAVAVFVGIRETSPPPKVISFSYYVAASWQAFSLFS